MSDAIQSPDDEDARFAREEMPGYAGTLIERDGTRSIMIADTTELAMKMQKIHARFAGDRKHPVGRVRAVRWNFDELKRAKDVIVTRGLGSTDWTVFDVAEDINRVVIGVADATQIGVARASLRKLGISDAMVEIQIIPYDEPEPTVLRSCSWQTTDCGTTEPETPPPGESTPRPADANGQTACFSFSLQCTQSRLVGGLEVYFAVPELGTSFYSSCTLGALAELGGMQGFLTAGHCGGLGRLTGRTYAQGEGSSVAVGQEEVDPTLTTNASLLMSPCYPGFVCRNSDVVFVKLANNPAYSQGYIARPTFKNWNDVNQRRQIASLKGYYIWTQRQPFITYPIASGTPVIKVGAFTGETDGYVSMTCVDKKAGYTPSNIPISVQCQYRVSPIPGYQYYVSGAGDSGAPVFTQESFSGASFEGAGARFEGILYGGTYDTSNPQYDLHYWFSTLWNMNKDFNRAFPGAGTPSTWGPL